MFDANRRDDSSPQSASGHFHFTPLKYGFVRSTITRLRCAHWPNSAHISQSIHINIFIITTDLITHNSNYIYLHPLHIPRPIARHTNHLRIELNAIGLIFAIIFCAHRAPHNHIITHERHTRLSFKFIIIIL